MQPTSNPRLVADQMLKADALLRALTNRELPMHPLAYYDVACWVGASFRSMDSASLRSLREVAPAELRQSVENVLHERGVVSWAFDDRVALSSLAQYLSLLRRCRRRSQE